MVEGSNSDQTYGGFFTTLIRNNETVWQIKVAFGTLYPGLKMREHLLTAPGILVTKLVTYPMTNRAQRCLTLVIK
jgi:hypothetical protein